MPAAQHRRHASAVQRRHVSPSLNYTEFRPWAPRRMASCCCGVTHVPDRRSTKTGTEQGGSSAECRRIVGPINNSFESARKASADWLSTQCCQSCIYRRGLTDRAIMGGNHFCRGKFGHSALFRARKPTERDFRAPEFPSRGRRVEQPQLPFIKPAVVRRQSQANPSAHRVPARAKRAADGRHNSGQP